ncbi:MAG: pitrilysin family protein [candidate division Zixibacteria bacterium]|nr:pitrilysin family protein [candidate division Zixibacteria bacterium]
MSTLKNFKPVILFFLLLFLPLPCFALPGSPVKVHFLDNGMQIITKEEHSKNLIALNIYVRGGSRTETPELSGLSHYYEHLIFRGGTDKQKELETRKVFQSLGQFRGFTSEDVTCYYMVAPKENLDEALWRYADAVMNLKVTQEKVESERQVVLEEFNMDEDQPGYSAWLLLEKNAFKVHPYGQTVLGSREVIKNADLDRFKTFYQERYVPNQMVMAIVGDFNTDEMMTKINSLFGKYPRGKESFELERPEPEQTKFWQAFKRMKSSSSYLNIGFHIPEASHPDIPTLDVLNVILGQGESSRLYQALKKEDNLVYSVGSSVDQRKDPGLFAIYTQLDPKNETKVVDIVFKKLSKLWQKEVLPEEIDKAKSKIENSYYFDNQTYISQAQRLSYYAANSDLLLESSYLDRIRSTTPSDIKRVALKYLKPSNATLAVVEPEDAPENSFIDIAEKYDSLLPAQAKEEIKAKPEKIILPNGLTLLLKEDHSSKTIALEGYIKGGLWLEEEKNAGICNFVTEMLLKGTEYSSDQIAQKIDSLGIELYAQSTPDYARVSLLTTPETFKPGLNLFSQALFNPVFPEKELENIRTDIIAQIQKVKDSSYDLTNQEFAREIYIKSPYKRPVLGYEETVGKLSSEDLRRFHQQVFVPSNIILSVVGDFNPEEMKNLLESEFERIRTRKTPKLVLIDEPLQKKERSRIIPQEKLQITFNLGRMGVKVTSPDYLSLKLVERILSSRLFFKYVYEEGMAYRMWTYMQPRLGSAPFTFEMGVSPENFNKARTGILSELRTLLNSPLSEKDVQTAKANLISGFYLSQQTNTDQARTMAFYEMAGLGYLYGDTYPDLVKKVKTSEIASAAKKYLDPDKFTQVAVGKIEDKK